MDNAGGVAVVARFRELRRNIFRFFGGKPLVLSAVHFVIGSQASLVIVLLVLVSIASLLELVTIQTLSESESKVHDLFVKKDMVKST